MRRTGMTVYVTCLASVLIVINLFAADYDRTHPNDAVTVLYLVAATVLMTISDVRIDQGRLTLNGITAGSVAILLNPLNATIVCFTIVLGTNRRRGPWPLIANPLIFATGTTIGAATTAILSDGSKPAIAVRLVTLATSTIANVAIASIGLAIQEQESPLRILRRNVTSSFMVAFGYFSLASLLVSSVLDGSPLGYFLATIVWVLALALTDSIAGRRIRSVLESELTDADRHLFHSRAVDGVVHNLRNHIATAHAYLKEIDPRKLDEVNRDNLTTATGATEDAVTVLHTLAQGATPKVSYAPNPVDLNELAAQAAGLARARARAKEIQIAVRESAIEVRVKADPLLIREVMTNLVNNAIDAAPHGGRVEIRTGRRNNNGWPFVAVGDNGPGVSDENRHHLFEPHFTTKEGGTGLGLFMSYGVVREHQGQLLFEGNHRGAVFVVVLPPFSG